MTDSPLALDLLRWGGPALLAAATAVLVDRWGAARRLDPPGFQNPWRRFAAGGSLALILYLTVFASLTQIGLPPVEVDLSSVPIYQLFVVHAMLLVALLGWFVFAFAGRIGEERSLLAVGWAQMGAKCPNLLKEIGLGLALGLFIWPLLLLVVGTVATFLFLTGNQELLPQQPPEMIVWIAGLPVVVKLAIAVSAGVVEELFFRGFLQPRIGIALSTILFAGAHLAYDEPFMLVGITLLSVSFAGLVAWRQNIWAAAAAHFLFDAVQLLFVIPWALGQWDEVEKVASEVAALL